MGDVQGWIARGGDEDKVDNDTRGSGRVPHPSTFKEVKDSGARQEFDTGARRDTQDGKPRYTLIPVGPLFRLAMHYTNGANKYGENNWTKGIPMSRSLESLERHIADFKMGKTDEDHLAAIAWNAFALMWYQDNMPEMDDLDDYLARKNGDHSG